MKKHEILNLDEAERFIQKITRTAGKEVEKLYGKVGVKYTKKYDYDVVTEADLKSHEILSSAIKKKYPTHGIISEEDKKYKQNAEYVWIVDPLDGTRNFAKGTPFFCVLVALTRNNEVILGTIYLPHLKEFYFARNGRGAKLNGKLITCSQKKDLMHSVCSGHTEIAEGYSETTMKIIRAQKKYNFWYLFTTCAGLDAALAATGRVDWYYRPYAGNVWDFAAAAIVMKEAGCRVTNMSGEDYKSTEAELIAANPALHKKIIKIVKKV